jgi:hypothetical protein
MAEEKEDNTMWYVVGGCIAGIILLVVLLKKDETKHLESGAVAQQQSEVFSKIEKRHTSNSSTAEQISGK